MHVIDHEQFNHVCFIFFDPIIFNQIVDAHNQVPVLHFSITFRLDVAYITILKKKSVNTCVSLRQYFGLSIVIFKQKIR